MYQLQKHKGIAPFRNKGWIWFKKVQLLMPTMPRGANVYRESQESQLPIEPENQELGHFEHEADSQDSGRPISQ